MDKLSEAMAAFDVTKVRCSVKNYSTQMSKDSDSSVDMFVFDTTDSSEESHALKVKPVDTDITGETSCKVTYCPGNTLEMKIDHLTELIRTQKEALSGLAEEVRRSNAAVQFTVETHAKIASELLKSVVSDCEDDIVESSLNPNANTLMAALNFKQKVPDSSTIKNAVQEVLLSDTFMQQLVDIVKAATTSELEPSLMKELSPAYEKHQYRLLTDLTRMFNQAFRKLDTNANQFCRESAKTTRLMRTSLERHLRAVQAISTTDHADTSHVAALMQSMLHKVLDEELLKWREQLALTLLEYPSKAPWSPLQVPFDPSSPPLPATSTPNKPVINQFDCSMPRPPLQPAPGHMLAARITMLIADGDVNGAFELALSAADLALVVQACRAAEPARVFGPPCQLRRHVVLSLVQQLATDMEHDTQLKCQYLEEAILNLDVDHHTTHLDLAFQDMKRNLTSFLTAYPGHKLSRRVRMVIMAADSFLTNKLHFH